jgi:hypothetical protein
MKILKFSDMILITVPVYTVLNEAYSFPKIKNNEKKVINETKKELLYLNTNSNYNNYEFFTLEIFNVNDKIKKIIYINVLNFQKFF